MGTIPNSASLWEIEGINVGTPRTWLPYGKRKGNNRGTTPNSASLWENTGN